MIVALDLETTGLDSKKDAIIEVALVKIDSKTFKKVDEYSIFINPGIEIPELISNITSITQKDIEGAPSFSDVREEIQEFIGGSPILGHNTNFDRGFLIENGINLDKNLVLDTFFLANFLLSHLKSLNLGYICNHLGITIESEHRAIYDTYGTVDVFVKLISLLQELSKENQEVFRYITDTSKDKQGIYYREKYLGKVKKISSDAFVKYIMSTISNKQKTFSVEQKYEYAPLNIDTIFEKLVDFEKRDNQKKMAEIVFDSLVQSKKSVIEAPTGLGKTFAYLIPSILFSTQMGEQVFISTSTKTLQDQVFFKDLAYLKKSLNLNFSYSKLKGKKNYLSLYALFEFLDSEDMYESNTSSFLLKILYWVQKTDSGELDELDFYGEEFSHLRKINAVLPYTLHGDNPYIQSEFIVRAREQAKKSNIVVINNHILFQDAVSGGRLLGKVKNLVLDEAHSLEDVVTQSCKKGFSVSGVEKAFGELEKHLRNSGDSVSELLLYQDTLMFNLGALFEQLGDYLFKKVDRGSRYRNTLIKSEFFASFESTNKLAAKIISTFHEISDYILDLPEKSQLLIGRESSYFDEVEDILRHIFSSEEVFKTIIPTISDRDGYGLILEYTLLNPGTFLQDYLWKQLDSVVMTSATLQIEESFDYISNMYYLTDFDFFVLDTDFDFQKQTLLFVPNDLGSIKFNAEQIFKFLEEFLLIVKGNSLVLFTSVAMVRDCYIALNHTLRSQNIQILAQSVSGSKQKQIESFKKSADHSVLVGTDALWQGVDIAGDDLKYLIIHKIPFMVPSDPVFQARSTLFQDSFQEYSVPKSILKLKQGFGRLIRTKSDTGVVIFLDDRIFSTRWGEKYFSAFPKDIPVRISPHQKLLSVIKK